LLLKLRIAELKHGFPPAVEWKRRAAALQ
jgi:hypothetical protein